ncbi:hypothetical protein HS088_TW15G00763 [Tripterygium wilfordii]|uniref:Uncharacterized protein n=1 Tax=Tripterygium wilfordii TaxID=458696 RepID=A0A7J7CMF8_TRIWF|nr:uncharacterized protein LOC120017078 [Tripterygium wilfordii]KAF5735262.1 hypothetical protein HS088_TW15G00763 [Tripterygium wilfordii]
MDDWRRSGQIPAFGDWDYTNQMPITQYFECARQAGLFRYSSSSGECDHQCMNNGDLYALDFKKKTSRDLGPPRKTKGRERNVKEQRKQGKVCDVTELPRKQSHQHRKMNSNYKKSSVQVINHPRSSARPPKPVDEDLYKIPPELLNSSKRKRKMGLFSCLVPACAS